jgi:hypothetical protein
MVVIKQLMKVYFHGLKQDYYQRYMHHCLVYLSLKIVDLRLINVS